MDLLMHTTYVCVCVCALCVHVNMKLQSSKLNEIFPNSAFNFCK